MYDVYPDLSGYTIFSLLLFKEAERLGIINHEYYKQYISDCLQATLKKAQSDDENNIERSM